MRALLLFKPIAILIKESQNFFWWNQISEKYIFRSDNMIIWEEVRTQKVTIS